MGRKRKTDRLYLQLKDMRVETSEPKIGEIRTGFQRGLKGIYFKYIWAACEWCGKPRWVVYRPTTKRPHSGRCKACSKPYQGSPREKHPCWNGGRTKTNGGYPMVYLEPDDFFYPMARGTGYVLEHRLVMAKSLGRCLQPWEIVHHRNHNREDNRIENLQLVTEMQHRQCTAMETEVKRLEKRVLWLEGENKRLREMMQRRSNARVR